jgi:hypothetical protein
VDGFVDVIGKPANCAAVVLTQPRLSLDLSAAWEKPGRVFVMKCQARSLQFTLPMRAILVSIPRLSVRASDIPDSVT